MFATKNIIVLSCFFTFCSGNKSFIQLFGYGLLADTFETYSTSDSADCVNECAAYDDCLGVQMLRGTGTCNLLHMIRAYTWDPGQCSFFIKNETTVTITGRNLDPMDQVIQNVVYASDNICPDGWTVDSLTCTLRVSESICNEYASSLEATWDGTNCVIAILTASYSCPNQTHILNNFTNGYYCYAVILRDKNVLPTNCTYDDVNNYCYQQTEAYLASIHSEDENEFIGSLRSPSKPNNGTAIGLIPDVSGYYANTCYYKWIDGTPLDYLKFENVSRDFVTPFALLNNDNVWITGTTQSSVFSMIFNFLACKREADVRFTVLR